VTIIRTPSGGLVMAAPPAALVTSAGRGGREDSLQPGQRDQVAHRCGGRRQASAQARYGADIEPAVESDDGRLVT